jgi:hypothetical protein
MPLMTACLVDRTPQDADFAPETWGELLAAIDGRLATRHRLVTAVRFDGVDQPSFRGADASARRVATLASLEVETESVDEVVSETSATAQSGIAVVSAACREIAAAFRRGDCVAANVRLVELVDVIRQLTLLTVTAVGATGLNLHTLACGATSAAERIDDACRALEALLDAQSRHDWQEAATCLDEALAPAIDQWASVFTAFEEQGR